MVSENTDWQVLIDLYLWMYESGCFDHVLRLQWGDLERGCENTRENAAKLKVARNHSWVCVNPIAHSRIKYVDENRSFFMCHMIDLVLFWMNGEQKTVSCWTCARSKGRIRH